MDCEMDCEICGAPGAQITLIGDFPATLCIAHMQAWHDFITPSELFSDLEECEAFLELTHAATMGGQYTVDDALLLAADVLAGIRDARARLYVAAEHWVKNEKEKRT